MFVSTQFAPIQRPFVSKFIFYVVWLKVLYKSCKHNDIEKNKHKRINTNKFSECTVLCFVNIALN